VILPRASSLPGVRDSKTLSEAAREQAYASILASAVSIGIGLATPEEITELNILRAAHLAMRRAIENSPVRPDCLLVDGLPVPLLPAPSEAIVHGDALSMSIAAASIVAKVTRDRIMRDLDLQYPGYGFSENKGYPTPDHLRALATLGPSSVHRMGFAPVRRAAGLTASESSSRTPHREGLCGEEWAAIYLERLGHRILSKRYRAAHAEIDIVSEDGPMIVFVEVKASARRYSDLPSSRLDPEQVKRIGYAAEAFLAEHGITNRPCRFDVVEVVRGRGRVPHIRHFRGAFMIEK
jgi:ribonuclease HII